MKKAILILLALVATTLVSIPTVAQDGKPKATNLLIAVIQRSQSEPRERPLASVGLFKVLVGDSPFDQAQCPSRSNGKGITTCRIACDPGDPTELTLVLRPPGSDAVPGYEIPVSQELTLAGCVLSDARVTFAYTPLELALQETLKADPELRRAVAMNAPTVTFATLKPFEESQQSLAALVARKPDDPNLERFARILQDASVASGQAPINPAATAKVQKFSVGVQSIYLNAAAQRSLGPAKAGQLAPITTDPARLRAASHEVRSALDQKPQKTPSEQLLHKELSKMPTDGGKAAASGSKVEWSKVNRGGGVHSGKQ